MSLPVDSIMVRRAATPDFYGILGRHLILRAERMPRLPTGRDRPST